MFLKKSIIQSYEADLWCFQYSDNFSLMKKQCSQIKHICMFFCTMYPCLLIDFTFFFLALNKIIKINLMRKTSIQAFSTTQILLTGKYLNPFFSVFHKTFPIKSNIYERFHLQSIFSLRTWDDLRKKEIFCMWTDW